MDRVKRSMQVFCFVVVLLALGATVMADQSMSIVVGNVGYNEACTRDWYWVTDSSTGESWPIPDNGVAMQLMNMMGQQVIIHINEMQRVVGFSR